MTRRDFLNGTLLASGAALVSAACPFQLMAADDWNGTSGIGDYAGANGNTHQVMADGHAIRDHAFDRAKPTIDDTGETFDCVIVGGGISGLAAALFYQRGTSAKRSCLVLENHPIFGGEAKRNEFNVDGQRLIASQGSAMWFQPMPRSFLEHFYDSVGIDPRQFQYPRNTSAIATGVTPYAGDGSNFGFFFAADARHANGTWLVDPWAKRLEGAPAELIRRHPFGRIAFANSDLSGIMDHRASITEAHRAVQRTLSFG
jgi:spermidine dehydrogenase